MLLPAVCLAGDVNSECDTLSLAVGAFFPSLDFPPEKICQSRFGHFAFSERRHGTSGLRSPEWQQRKQCKDRPPGSVALSPFACSVSSPPSLLLGMPCFLRLIFSGTPESHYLVHCVRGLTSSPRPPTTTEPRTVPSPGPCRPPLTQTADL